MIKIHVNNRTEVSGYVDDKYFVIYKDSSKPYPVSELALIEAIDELELERAKIRCALEWLEHYPSMDGQEEQAEVNRSRAIRILSGDLKVRK